MKAWRNESCVNLNRRNAPGVMNVFEGKPDVGEKGFDAIIQHLEISGIKYDSSRITVFEQDLLGKFVLHKCRARLNVSLDRHWYQTDL